MPYNGIFIIVSVVRTLCAGIVHDTVCIVFIHGDHAVVAIVFLVIYVIYTGVT